MSHEEFSALIQTISQLRDPNTGCPWDLKQTHQSLLKYLIEECYEFIYAVETQDILNMQEELGDVLLQVVLHAQLARERGDFNIDDICRTINEKMISRHPHVFKDNQNKLSESEIIKNWEELKKAEKAKKDSKEELIPVKVLMNSPLKSCYHIGVQSQKIGFDWDRPSEVFEKVQEEVAELAYEIEHKSTREKIEEEFGDTLFTMVQLARHLQLDPEDALKKANQKFMSRVQKMEKICEEDKTNFHSLSRDKKEALWQQAKQELKSGE